MKSNKLYKVKNTFLERHKKTKLD